MLGEVIGSYEILRVLGEGGMGVVYLARHQMIGRLAAVKVLLPEYSAKQEMVTRIFNEARVTAAIHHPGLVGVYDFGRHTDGSAYLVMEYLEGEPLSAMIDREKRLVPELVTSLGRQIASAMAAAHANGVIHRDLKSDNVYIVRDEETELGIRAKLLDFGIAKLAGDAQVGGLKTRTGSLLGTPAYMSPEQCRGAGSGAFDSRSDIYSLGCILFEMACGRRPFTHEGMGELIAAHLYEEPPRPRALAPSLPVLLEELILACLEKDPAKRPQTMDALASALGSDGKAARGKSLRQTVPPAAPTVKGTPSTFNRLAGEVRPSPRPRRVLIAGLGAVALAAVVTVAVMATRPAALSTSLSPPPAPQPVQPEPADPVPAPEPVPTPVLVPEPVALTLTPIEPVGEAASTGAFIGGAPPEPAAVATPPPAEAPKRKKRAPAQPSGPAQPQPIQDGALDPYGGR